ncbi:MAG: methionine aminotransferase [Bacteroidetes bacterium]|jgi:methionine aminotransferase|nr:methionine aminotransferase [Bacteroidota bacterium]MBX7237929.1 methionine aminotransferase [Bacteroidia bacterium]MCC7515022.1 methionine aminotransferase [Bacteroidia bacterium]MCW5919002.1 methionine aminotransferase [Bacteroidota bacterium]HMW09793.1 methionine aminotransferase [Bacteroidia bacterium]
MSANQALIKSKLPKTGNSIFSVMSALANECNAINLSQGFPDFAISPELISLVTKYMKKGMNQYAPMPGIMPLREEIAAKIEARFSAKYNPETEITITAGGTQAIYTAIASVVREGDEVIIFDPAYDSYAPAVVLAGGEPVHAELKMPDFHIDWNEVKKLMNQRTRMIMINTPHNPTGAILSVKDFQMLEKITAKTDIFVLSDEVYEHVIFDGYEHQSVARFPKLAERSFIVYSFGKTFHTTGWKMGYCLAPAKLSAEFRKAHQFMVFSANTPIQYAYAEFMKDAKNYSGIEKFYQEKRDYFLKLIQGTAFKPLACSGSYFQLLDYSKLSREKDMDYAVKLTKDYGVASIPVSAFYRNGTDHKLLRFCFAKSEETLEKAAERLHKVEK